MTLVLNEIHIINGLENTFMIAAADRGITYTDGKKKSWRKIFEIPYLHGAISYFGLAEFSPLGKNGLVSFTTWLPNFINKNTKVENLQTFAYNLRKELNNFVPTSFLRKYHSGFHICGYDIRGYPEFWSLTNIKKFSDFTYSDLQECYQDPANDFQGRDLINLGWDGSDPLSAKNNIQFYRNGDIRAHGRVFENIDNIYSYLSQFPDFLKIDNHSHYKDYVTLKFEILAYIYRKMTKNQIIRRPIDVILLEKP
jgi:hypothetical protein